MTPIDKQDARACGTFLRWLFDSAGSDDIADMWLVVLLIHPTEPAPDGKSGNLTKARSFQVGTGIDDAVDFVMEHRHDWNCFVGVNPMLEKPKGNSRGKLSNVGAVTAFFADVDVANELRNDNKVYARDMDDARSIVSDVGLRPSMILNSGYGIQGYWLLREPWVLDSATERAELHGKSKQWGATVNAVARTYSATIDSANDITRVLRLPGSYNLKNPEDPRRVLFITPDKRDEEPVRWNLDDFDPYYVASSMVGTGAKLGDVPPVIPGRDLGQQLAEKLAASLETSPGLAKTWEGKNKDLEDQSPSSYDMSLANYLYDLGFEPQEIADCMFELRRKMGWKVDKVTERRDYVQRTIARAMCRSEADAAVNAMARGELKILQGADTIRDAVLEVSDGDEDVAEAAVVDARAEALACLSQALEVKVARLVQMGREDSQWQIELDLEDRGGRQLVSLGPTADVMSQAAVRKRLYEVAHVMLKQFKPKQWESLLKVIVMVVEEEENLDTDPRHLIRNVLRTVFDSTGRVDEDDWGEAVKTRTPFIRQDIVGVMLSHVKRHLQAYELEHLSTSKLSTMLRAVGFESRNMGTTIDGQKVQGHYWVAPTAVVKDILPGGIHASAESRNEAEPDERDHAERAAGPDRD